MGARSGLRLVAARAGGQSLAVARARVRVHWSQGQWSVVRVRARVRVRVTVRRVSLLEEVRVRGSGFGVRGEGGVGRV